MARDRTVSIQDIMNMTQEQRLAYTLEQYKNSPGFFTPYKSFKDFTSTLFSPIAAPLILATLTVFLAVAAVIAAILAAAALLTAIVTCACSCEFAGDALAFGLTAGVFALAVAVVAFPLLVIATVLSIPLTALSIFTRGAATAVDCCLPSDDTNSSVSYA